MDKDGFVQALNEDLRTEFRSIVQYVQHIAIVKGAEYMSTVDELRMHVGQELQHALVLAEQIEFLGGTPTTSVSVPPSVSDSRQALELDLELETAQLERYRERSGQANELQLPDVAEALRPLLEQTQEHVRDLQAVLGG
jgi:bacterioferritin